jgi:hypothetical protein
MKQRSLFKRVFDFARAELERRARNHEELRGDTDDVPSRVISVQPRMEASPEVPAAPAVQGLEVLRGPRAGLKLVWSLSDEQIAHARTLIDSEAVLCVRVVAYSPLRDDVLREVQDRPGVEPRGSCEVGTVDGPALVSVGLRAGDRFVSIAHHVL